jgi:hypothetical protein
MQSRSENFRAQAAECQEIAKRCGDELRRQYEQLAQQWLELAERAESGHITRKVA